MKKSVFAAALVAALASAPVQAKAGPDAVIQVAENPTHWLIVQTATLRDMRGNITLYKVDGNDQCKEMGERVVKEQRAAKPKLSVKPWPYKTYSCRKMWNRKAS